MLLKLRPVWLLIVSLPLAIIWAVIMLLMNTNVHSMAQENMKKSMPGDATNKLGKSIGIFKL